MLPVFSLKSQIILKDIFSADHLTLFPLSFIIASLYDKNYTLGYISLPSPWKWPLSK